MENFVRFWWECALRASHQGASFANNWQWVFGIPLVAGMASYAAGKWTMGMTVFGNPIADGIAAAFAAFVITWTARFLFQFVRAPVFRFNEQKMRADALEQRLIPKISGKYDPTIEPCKSDVVFGGGIQGVCFRLVVVNMGETDIDDCEGRLIEARDINRRQEIGTWNLTWANPQQSRVIKLIRGIPEYLDIVNVREDGGIVPATEGRVWPINRQDMFTCPGNYIFAIVVSGTGSIATPKYSVVLSLTGDWRTADMREIN
jgi:hypothetical protein